MNTSGGAPVSLNTQLGITIPHMFAIGVGLLAGGIVLTLLAILLLVLGVRAKPRPPAAGSPHGAPDQARPASPPSPPAGQIPHQGTPTPTAPAPTSTTDP